MMNEAQKALQRKNQPSWMATKCDKCGQELGGLVYADWSTELEGVLCFCSMTCRDTFEGFEDGPEPQPRVIWDSVRGACSTDIRPDLRRMLRK